MFCSQSHKEIKDGEISVCIDSNSLCTLSLAPLYQTHSLLQTKTVLARKQLVVSTIYSSKTITTLWLFFFLFFFFFCLYDNRANGRAVHVSVIENGETHLTSLSNAISGTMCGARAYVCVFVRLCFSLCL